MLSGLLIFFFDAFLIFFWQLCVEIVSLCAAILCNVFLVDLHLALFQFRSAEQLYVHFPFRTYKKCINGLYVKCDLTLIVKRRWTLYRKSWSKAIPFNNISHSYDFVCRDSSVGIATRYVPNGRGSNPGRSEIFHTGPDGPAAHPASFTMGTGSVFRG